MIRAVPLIWRLHLEARAGEMTHTGALLAAHHIPIAFLALVALIVPVLVRVLVIIIIT